jgi:selenoprotein N
MRPIAHDLYKNLLNQIKWDEEIDMQDALDSLEKSFFPFKEVKYYPFLDAFKQAQTNNRLVHCMLLWGALDDQSC